MFPNFAPNIRPDDPRLIQIAEHMREKILKPPKNVDPNKLEFEVKLGQLMLNEPFKQEVE